MRSPRSPSGLLFGVAPDAIRAAAAAFTGVEHRLEPVALIDGVRFVNDSQGTQPDAVIAALRAFEAPVVLIAGGRDKGVDLSGLPPVVAERAVAAVLIGESGPELGARVPRRRARPHVERADSLDGGGRAGRRARPRGPGCRRSWRRVSRPCCSARPPRSFDMFVDYAARGRAFKEAVRERSRRRAEGGTDEPGTADPAASAGPGSTERQPETVKGIDVRRTANRSPAKDPTQVLQRERHQADYVILVVVVALLGDRHPDGLFVVGDARLPVAD